MASERLFLLLRQAVKQSGVYDPDYALTFVEEDMTQDEAETAQRFLSWCYYDGHTFGHNIAEVFAEWERLGRPIGYDEEPPRSAGA